MTHILQSGLFSLRNYVHMGYTKHSLVSPICDIMSVIFYELDISEGYESCVRYFLPSFEVS